MRFFFKLIFLLILLAPLALIGAAFLTVDIQPTVSRAAEVTPASIERAKHILDQNDPRKLKSGARRTVSISQGDLDLAANYLAHQYARGSARVALKNRAVEISASLRLPLIPIGLYLNFDTLLVQDRSQLRWEQLRIGRLSLPPQLASWLASRALALAFGAVDLNSFAQVMKQVSVEQRRVALTYEWQTDLPDKLRAVLLPPDEQVRLRVYQKRLAEVTQALKSGNVSIIEFLAPLFKLAAGRSSQNPAAAENRAAIFVLMIYINGGSLDKILPDARSWTRPSQRGVTLSKRDDFAKHFIVSAALAANAGGPLANAVGLYKEIADSRGGSGFSFNDIAADRAGTRFGEYAANRASAKPLQQKLAAGLSEKGIMPDTADLPEDMQETELERVFGGVDGPEYKMMMAEIERRIAALPLYR
ncbi:MAG: Protein of unknown function periplasmic lipoprotein [Deltaproteobacteria bacterium]|nr:Protein of unknown function periplasmic lipoprotein [Deltaproteobacteria bacterium]